MKKVKAVFSVSGTCEGLWSNKILPFKYSDKKAELEMLGYKITIEKLEE